MPYAHGAIEDTLPGSDERLDTDWALQHPLDYIDVVERGIPEALSRAGVDPARVIGIGVDFTSCTVLPTTPDGTPAVPTGAVARRARTPGRSSGSTTPRSPRPTA